MMSIELVAKLFVDKKITQEEFIQLVNDLNKQPQIVTIKEDPNGGGENGGNRTTPAPKSPWEMPFTTPVNPYRYPGYPEPSIPSIPFGPVVTYSVGTPTAMRAPIWNTTVTL